MSLFGDLDMDEIADDPFALKDASYVVHLTDIIVKKTKAGDKTGMTFVYVIAEGDNAKQEIREWKVLPEPADPKNPTADEAKSLSYIKSRFIDFGVPPEKVGSVTPEDVVGTKLVVRVANENGYTNVKNVQKVDADYSSSNVSME